MIVPQYDLYLDVPDHPGIIGRIATDLGTNSINLSNMQIIESREDVPGVMRLSFRNEIEQERAKSFCCRKDTRCTSNFPVVLNNRK